MDLIGICLVSAAVGFAIGVFLERRNSAKKHEQALLTETKKWSEFVATPDRLKRYSEFVDKNLQEMASELQNGAASFASLGEVLDKHRHRLASGLLYAEAVRFGMGPDSPEAALVVRLVANGVEAAKRSYLDQLRSVLGEDKASELADAMNRQEAGWRIQAALRMVRDIQ